MENERVIGEAIVFATRKHEGQLRKGTDTPYITHPMHVMSILQSLGCNTDVIVAGALHDTLEDTKTTEDEIRTNFGSEVLGYIKGMSEDKTKSWKERKSTTIKNLDTDSDAVKLICFADKYSNLLSMEKDLQVCGSKLWERFKAPKNEIEWYYRGVGNALSSFMTDNSLYKDYIKTLDIVFGAK